MFKEAMKNATLWYQTGNELYKNRLIDCYDRLSDSEQHQADCKIIKFMPCWAE